MKKARFTRNRALFGADSQIRTGDLILTNLGGGIPACICSYNVVPNSSRNKRNKYILVTFLRK